MGTEKARMEVQSQIQFQLWKEEKFKQEESIKIQSLKDEEMRKQNSKTIEVKNTIHNQEAKENEKMKTGRTGFLQSMLTKESKITTEEIRQSSLDELRALDLEKQRE